uniref:Carboxypeptidase N subunit 2-like n=1 Tax=Diabrotica virgifera virgifera TaxID=50390 RepID=A0A6P7FZM7_DIAVI
MALVLLFLVLFVHISSENLVDITFRNVTFNGYFVFTPRFKPTILLGNNLKDFIPNTNFDNIEFIDQKIPIFYKDAIADIDRLTELYVENCNVEEIRPGTFRNVSNLSKLSFRYNKLRLIENGVFNHLNLTTLDLSFNQISVIYPDAFNHMHELFHINLAYNLIPTWNPKWFKDTPNLYMLYFKANLIKELPAHSFKNLKRSKLSVLELIFASNNISKIDPQAFSEVRQINLLSLSNNKLESFDKDLLKNVVVWDLRLNNNSISCFDGDLDKLFKAPYNYIEYNPFTCPCLHRLKHWSNKRGKELGIADSKCTGGDDEEEEDKVIEMEEVFEVEKDVYAIQKITLVLPKNSKLRN